MRYSTEKEHLINDLIAGRRSLRSFDECPIPKSVLFQLLEAARWAPSCFNEQPWRYIVALKSENPDGWQRLFECLNPPNQIWCQRAPVLMLAAYKTFFEIDNKPNKHALHDLGAASAFLSIQAQELGIIVHQMAGFDAQKARAQTQIPERFEPIVMISLGYPGPVEMLTEVLQKKEREPAVRFGIENWAFDAQWGNRLL
jgi:nitroreductase